MAAEAELPLVPLTFFFGSGNGELGFSWYMVQFGVFALMILYYLFGPLKRH